MKVKSIQREASTSVIVIEYDLETRHLCPCCRYPTLTSRGWHQICELCNWEDDGQDDASADKVRGGPNFHFSLMRARDNFAAHLTMYDESHPYFFDDTEAMRGEKRRLMAAFEAFKQIPDGTEAIAAWQRVGATQASLRFLRRVRMADRTFTEDRGKRYLDYRERRHPGFKARLAVEVAERNARRVKADTIDTDTK